MTTTTTTRGDASYHDEVMSVMVDDPNDAEHEHEYLGDEYDGAPSCPVDDCSWNRVQP